MRSWLADETCMSETTARAAASAAFCKVWVCASHVA
jgi:hypothetical protein